MKEKEYLFNPFAIEKIENDNLKEMYQDIYSSINIEPNTMYEYANNIEIYTNLLYICGDCIARYTKNILELKTKIDIDKAINTTSERKNWETEWGKVPAMSYFEALATRMSQDDINLLADSECRLKRFKNAYSSIEEKINALKKKMESIKYEEF